MFFGRKVSSQNVTSKNQSDKNENYVYYLSDETTHNSIIFVMVKGWTFWSILKGSWSLKWQNNTMGDQSIAEDMEIFGLTKSPTLKELRYEKHLPISFFYMKSSLTEKCLKRKLNRCCQKSRPTWINLMRVS